MAMKVLHNSCSMHIHDLPDMNALILQALGIHISGKSLVTMLKPLATYVGTHHFLFS